MKTLGEWVDYAKRLYQNYWVLVALGLALLALAVRYVFLMDSIRIAKEMGKDTHRAILGQYRTRSFQGWVLMGSAWVIATAVICFRQSWPALFSRKDALWLALVLYLIGLLGHARQFHAATLAALRKKTEPERTL